MPTTWVLVANRAGAHIYESHGPGKGLVMMQEIPHPDGRLKNRELKTDKPGRSFESGSIARHAMGEQVSPTEHVAEQWAKELAELLETARGQGKYDRLVLAAEPGFLGVLQNKVSKGTADRIVGTVKKELAHSSAGEIAEQVGAVIAV